MKSYLLLLLIASLQSNAHNHLEATLDPKCHLLLSSLSVDSEEWARLSTRFGEADPGYLKRMHDSSKEVFEPFLLKGINEKLTQVDYEAMLRHHHKVATSGLDGRNRYWGFSRKGLNFLWLNFAKPGRFRHELMPLLSWQRWRLKIAPKEMDYEKVPAYISSKTHLELDLPLKNKKHLPLRKVNKDGSVDYRYSPASEIPNYLQQMGNVMLGIINKIKNDPKISPDELAQDLALYIQLSANAHVFNVGNYSIAMNQVNSILRWVGHSGLEQKNFDYHSLVENQQDFYKRFLRELKKAT